MTIRLPVKKQNMFGLQGGVSFDPQTVNGAIAAQLKKYISGDQGMASAGGITANQLKTNNGYQQSNVYSSAQERDAVLAHREKELQEYLEQTFGAQAAAAGQSISGLLQSQGINNIGYQRDDFIKMTQNPLRASTEKKINAMAKMTGARTFNNGATDGTRLHTGFYRPEEAKQARKYVTQAIQKANNGLGNQGELEGYYLSGAQKMEARSAQKITNNDRAAKWMNDEKHPLVTQIRSDILKQEAKRKLVDKVRKGLEDSGEIDGPAEKKKEMTPAQAAARGGAIVAKILSTVGSLKSLFTSAVGYLQNIASGIGGLKRDAASLGVPVEKIMQLQNMGKLNAVSGGSENTFVDAAKGYIDLTSDPSKLAAIKWDSAALQGQTHLIRPIIDEAVKMKLNPVDLMYKINNTLGAAYFDPKLNTEQRAHLRTKQIRSLESLPGGAAFAQAYQVSTDAANMYGLTTGKNRYSHMQAVQNNSNKSESRAMVYEAFGLTTQNSTGSMGNQRKLNEFDRLIKTIEDMMKQFAMVHMDDITRAMSELALALLKFVSWFDKDGTAAKLAEVLERRMKFSAKNDRKELTRNMTVVDRALRKQLEAVGYSGAAAEGIIQEGINATRPEDVMAGLLLRKGSTDKFDEAAIRKLFILSNKNRKMQRELFKFDNGSAEDRTSIDTYDLENEGQNNSAENIIIYNSLKNQTAVQENEFINLTKGVGKIKDSELIQKSKVPLPAHLQREADLEAERQKRADDFKAKQKKTFLDFLPSQVQDMIDSLSGVGIPDIFKRSLEQVASNEFKGKLEVAFTKDGAQVGSVMIDLANDAQRRVMYKIDNIS